MSAKIDSAVLAPPTDDIPPGAGTQDPVPPPTRGG